jgi:hypothetical protein
MANAILVQPIYQFFDDNGAPLAAGKLYHWVAGGSSVIAPVFHNSNLSSAWTNPIVLDSAGRIPGQVFCPSVPAIRWILTDANDVQVGATADNVSQFVPATA